MGSISAGASRSAMIAALRGGVGGEAAAQGVEVGLAGGGEHEPDEAGAALGRVDGVVAGEPADLLQRRQPRERRLERGGVGRAIQPSGAEPGEHPARAAQGAEVVDERAGLGEELDVHHPAGAELDLPGVGGGGLVRLGEAAAHVGGVGEHLGGVVRLGEHARRWRRRPRRRARRGRRRTRARVSARCSQVQASSAW